MMHAINSPPDRRAPMSVLLRGTPMLTHEVSWKPGEALLGRELVDELRYEPIIEFVGEVSHHVPNKGPAFGEPMHFPGEHTVAA
jgi:hypothetical protein